MGSEYGQQVIVLQEFTYSWITARDKKRREASVMKPLGPAHSSLACKPTWTDQPDAKGKVLPMKEKAPTRENKLLI